MDTITLRNIEFHANHGVYPEEKEQGQKFIIDCSYQIDSSICFDDLNKTIDYSLIAKDIVNYCTSHCFDLLEMLLNSLAKYLLTKYSLLADLTLTVHKPEADLGVNYQDITLTIQRKKTIAYLALGSNLNDKQANLNLALELINQDENIELLKKSTFITTKPYGVLDQPDFLNGVIKISTIYTSQELLAFCQKAEKKAQRIKTRVWGERTLDVDILIYGDLIMHTPTLQIPHPELHLRNFVLEPFLEIEPYFIHPVFKQHLKQLKDNLNHAA